MATAIAYLYSAASLIDFAINTLMEAVHRCKNCGKPLGNSWVCDWRGWDNLNDKEAK